MKKDYWRCQKCKKADMQYQPMASSSVYVCHACHWIEFTQPPWPDRTSALPSDQLGGGQ